MSDTTGPATAAIMAAGLACGAGLCLADCLASYAGRRNTFRRERTAVGPDGLPPTLALAMPFDQPRDAATRLLLLLQAALSDALAAPGAACVEPGPIMVLLPPWAPMGMRRTISAGLPQNWPDLRFAQGEDVSSLGLLGYASRAIAAGKKATVLVCAVDSLTNADRLDHLMLNRGLFDRSTPYGVVPGEAAAAMLLTADAATGALARVRDVHAAVEQSGHRGALRGRELANCMQRLAPALDPPPTRLLTDLAGPRPRAEAFGVGMANGGPAVGALAGRLEAPSLVLGELGEAFGLVLGCLALGTPPRGFPDGDTALLVTAARPGAAVLERLSRVGAAE